MKNSERILYVIAILVLTLTFASLRSNNSELEAQIVAEGGE